MKPFYAFKNLDGDAELALYDEIGFWGTNAKDFHSSLKSIKGAKLTVHINSPGGNVVDGYAIYNMLKAFKGDVTVVVDGIAASIASVIAMAGKTIRMPENALMFIHNPLVMGAIGDAEELRKTASDLDKLKDGILSIYEARSGSDRAKISKMMDAETLLTAKEAVLLGFADEMLPENKAAAKADFKVTDYHPGIKLPTEATTAPAGAQNKNKENDMDLAQAQEQIRTLTAENTNLKKDVETSKTKAQQDATQAANTAEKTRKDAIKAHAAKYNKDGDLDEATINALAGDTTVEAFKDTVTDIIAKRGTKPAIKPGAEPENKDDFAARLAKCKTGAERRALIRENRKEAVAHERQSRLTE